MLASVVEAFGPFDRIRVKELEEPAPAQGHGAHDEDARARRPCRSREAGRSATSLSGADADHSGLPPVTGSTAPDTYDAASEAR